jgi:hypothetical protein
VLRNGSRRDVALWELQASDLVLATDQRFHPIVDFPDLRQYFPQLAPPLIGQLTVSDILLGIGTIFIVGAGVCLLSAAAIALFTPERNDVPLTRKDRAYIRERDGEFCFYCETHAPGGHVDHRVSRANGGGNDYDNLAWACAPCNWSKGAMNDTEFLTLLQ